jgi:hypothetical protein
MVGSVEPASVRFDRSQTAGEACTVEQGRTGDNAAGGDGVSPFLRATGSVLCATCACDKVSKRGRQKRFQSSRKWPLMHSPPLAGKSTEAPQSPKVEDPLAG